MFKIDCFIRKDTPELRQRLIDLGYKICPCSDFEGSIWLSILPINGTVHGVGFWDNSGLSPIDTQEKALAQFLFDAQSDGSIDCGDNEELFIALAALRDDTAKNQWFVIGNKDTGDIWTKCYNDMPDKYVQLNGHKATPEEIINHFTRIFG